MSSLNHILAKPEFIEGIGFIYPVKLKEYDVFIEHSSVLYYKQDLFIEDLRELNLLDLIVVGLKDEKIVKSLEIIFSIVLKKEVRFFINQNNDSYGFSVDNENIIDKTNYEELRKIIMNQNLMFEQKVYKNKLVQEWANKVLEARAKNSLKMELEDMITTVSVFTGKHYSDLAEYTFYQLKSDFSRISKFVDYDASIAFKCAGADSVSINHYAENIDMFINPHDDVFKSKSKLGKLDDAIK